MFVDVKDMAVWQKAHGLVMKVYNCTKYYPKDEMYGLTSQLRRAAVSIPSNISEGKARGSSKEYVRFLRIARGSLEEVKYQVYLSKELTYITIDEYEELSNLCEEVGKLINYTINKIGE